MRKVCMRCKIEKDISEFSKHKNTKDGLQSWCKICNKSNCKQYRVNNRDKVIEYKKQYYKNNRDKVIGYQKKYCENNREKCLEYKRNWRINNPHKTINYHVLARAGITDKITKEDYDSIIESSGGVCFYCGRDDVDMTIDHWVPLSRGGDHCVSNMVCACRSCNSSKGFRLYRYEWTPNLADE